MIIVNRNDQNQIAFTAVHNKTAFSGVYKLVFKSSVTKQEKYVIPNVVLDNDRYILLEFVESYFDDPASAVISLRGGFYPQGQYTYELWETTTAPWPSVALIEQGEMKLLSENIAPEIQYYFYQGDNPQTQAYVYVTPATPSPGGQVWNTTNINWELDDAEWQTA